MDSCLRSVIRGGSRIALRPYFVMVRGPMFRTPQRIVLLLAFSLLTSAATVSAECAWVLWSTYVANRDRPERSMSRAFASQRDCEAAMPDAVQGQLRAWRSRYETVAVSPADQNVVIARGKAENDSLMIRVSCWPQGLEPTGLLPGAKYREQSSAWVAWAWVKALPSGRTFWDITPDAFETKSECEAHASKRRAEAKAKPDRQWDQAFICFPAGTDPRQPIERSQ